MAEKQELKVRVKDNSPFYTNDISISVNPSEFIIDFKNMSQVQDLPQHQALVVEHQPITISAFQVKNVLDMLSKAVKDYEKKFGKIDKPKAIKKAEKIIEKKKKTKKVPKTTKPENYFG